MSDSAPSCSCRLPWLVTIIALGVLVAWRFSAVPVSSGTPAGSSDTHPIAPPPLAPVPPPAAAPDPRIATLHQELEDVRRVLDDAQSALADRDREIATANDEIRVLRRDLEALRTRNAGPAP